MVPNRSKKHRNAKKRQQQLKSSEDDQDSEPDSRPASNSSSINSLRRKHDKNERNHTPTSDRDASVSIEEKPGGEEDEKCDTPTDEKGLSKKGLSSRRLSAQNDSHADMNRSPFSDMNLNPKLRRARRSALLISESPIPNIFDTPDSDDSVSTFRKPTNVKHDSPKVVRRDRPSAPTPLAKFSRKVSDVAVELSRKTVSKKTAKAASAPPKAVSNKIVKPLLSQGVAKNSHSSEPRRSKVVFDMDGINVDIFSDRPEIDFYGKPDPERQKELRKIAYSSRSQKAKREGALDHDPIANRKRGPRKYSYLRKRAIGRAGKHRTAPQNSPRKSRYPYHENDDPPSRCKQM